MMFDTEADAQEQVIAAINQASETLPHLVNQAVQAYPESAVLLYLKASICVERSDITEAFDCFAKAVNLAPEFDIARFQLAFLALTTGELDVALTQFEFLTQHSQVDYLQLFSSGFCALIRHDDEAKTRELLTAGMAKNSENPSLNQNMSKVIEILSQPGPTEANDSPEAEEINVNTPSGLSSGALLNIYNKDE